METEWGDELFAHFSLAEEFDDPVIVSRFQADGSIVPIGQIRMEFSCKSENDPPMYISVDNKGKEIFPPTTDLFFAERMFEKYAKRLTKQEEIRKKKSLEKSKQRNR